MLFTPESKTQSPLKITSDPYFSYIVISYFCLASLRLFSCILQFFKNSDTASSEMSNENVKKGTYYLIATSFLNLFLLTCNAGINVVLFLMNAIDWAICSTGLDFLQFSLFWSFVKKFVVHNIKYFKVESNYKSNFRLKDFSRIHYSKLHRVDLWFLAFY